MHSWRLAVLATLLGTTACNTTPSTIDSAAVQATVKDSATSKLVSQYYEKTGWKPAWSGGNAKALDAALGARVQHGLDHLTFLKLPDSGASATERDVARTAAALAYASALARGFSDPRKLHDIYTIPRPAPDLAAGLAKALADGKVAQWLDSLAPQDGDYRTLSKAYLEALRAAGDSKAQARIPSDGGTIHPGDDDPRMPEITQQLAASGYLTESAQAGGAGERYTPQLVAAVKALQRDYGAKDDGVIGGGTLDVLNMGPAARARAIAVALERLRWLERNPPATRIDVNTAAAQLIYWRDGKQADQRKVVVGQPGKETPQIQAPFYRLVANPTWTIPRSIQNGELAGKSDDYLQAHNMTWRDGWIVQESGPDNSLGLVKFDMRDPYEIYLHDTNAPALFGSSQRQRSHGCVRVFDALGFAAMIARQEGVADKWNEARESGEQTFVPLPQPIPVRLLYQTVFVASGGAVQVHTDPYGWDDAIAAKLGFNEPTRARFRANGEDIGP